jgi:hypothetical protein
MGVLYNSPMLITMKLKKEKETNMKTLIIDTTYKPVGVYYHRTDGTYPEVNLVADYDLVKNKVKKGQFPADCKISAMLNQSWLNREALVNRSDYDGGDSVFEQIYDVDTYKHIK